MEIEEEMGKGGTDGRAGADVHSGPSPLCALSVTREAMAETPRGAPQIESAPQLFANL